MATPSWQTYIDTQLVSTGAIDGAAIFAKSDGLLWAATPNFAVMAAPSSNTVWFIIPFGGYLK